MGEPSIEAGRATDPADPAAAIDASAAPSNDPPLPTGSTLEPTPDLRLLSKGRILIGGAPFTITRLSGAGASLVTGWFAGHPVSHNPKHQVLARRLIRSGMAQPRYPDDADDDHDDLAQLTVIIPVKDDQSGLEATLRSLVDPDGQHRFAAIVVIDDGSQPPLRVSSFDDCADHSPVISLRNERAAGPGQARQRGLDLARSELVAFVDAGVVATAADLAQLASTFRDPATVAVAPRVASTADDHLVARFDQTRSPLDLGPGRSLVGPGRHVTYAPSACLLVKRSALERVGGFDPALRYGEDVDLVWRLGAIGEVWYQPSVTVHHPSRPDLVAMARQRRSYGSAAGPLAARHGDVVAPVRISPWSALVFALTASGRPLTALTAASGTALALRPKIAPLPDLTIEAFMLTGRGHWYGGLSILTATVRAWSPLLLVGGVLFPSQRRRLASVALAAFARRLLDGPRSPADAIRDVTLGAVDDLSYCAGVWEGVIKNPSADAAKALLPAMMSWPKARSEGSDRTATATRR